MGSKFSRPFFNQSEVKPKPIVARACTFSRALRRLRVITSSFDWFAGLSPSFLIGQCKWITLVLVLRHSFESRSNSINFIWFNLCSFKHCRLKIKVYYNYFCYYYWVRAAYLSVQFVNGYHETVSEKLPPSRQRKNGHLLIKQLHAGRLRGLHSEKRRRSDRDVL